MEHENFDLMPREYLIDELKAWREKFDAKVSEEVSKEMGYIEQRYEKELRCLKEPLLGEACDYARTVLAYVDSIDTWSWLVDERITRIQKFIHFSLFDTKTVKILRLTTELEDLLK